MTIIKPLALLLALLLSGCANYQMTRADVGYFQPPIFSGKVPEKIVTGYSIYNNTIRVGLAPMRPIVPSFDGGGKLLASWNPNPEGIKGSPSVVIVHGGHGLVPSNFMNAVWARKELRGKCPGTRQLLEPGGFRKTG